MPRNRALACPRIPHAYVLSRGPRPASGLLRPGGPGAHLHAAVLPCAWRRGTAGDREDLLPQAVRWAGGRAGGPPGERQPEGGGLGRLRPHRGPPGRSGLHGRQLPPCDPDRRQPEGNPPVPGRHLWRDRAGPRRGPAASLLRTCRRAGDDGGPALLPHRRSPRTGSLPWT